MTYRSRGRSLIELVLAVTFVGFLVGFVAVLCVGNYFRAKRAAERQRQRRLEKQQQASLQYNGGAINPQPPQLHERRSYSKVHSPTSEAGEEPLVSPGFMSV